MSSTSHHSQTQSQAHGSTGSYVVGFVLSIVFTIIPYLLVVNKIMTGAALIVTILVIAIIQMAIQMLFFLHLGRGPKPLYNIVFFFATAGVIVITIGASLFIMDNLYRNMAPDEIVLRKAQEENIAQVEGNETGACVSMDQSRIITIADGAVSPHHIYARLCDKLVFVNEDDEKHTFVFSDSNGGESYGGLFEVQVDKGESEVITLNQAGSFLFTDAGNPEVFGYFTVEQ